MALDTNLGVENRRNRSPVVLDKIFGLVNFPILDHQNFQDEVALGHLVMNFDVTEKAYCRSKNVRCRKPKFEWAMQ